MKNTYKILLFLFLTVTCSKSNAQLDTLNYLKTNFEIQKSEYIGKPFSYLLSKMNQIQPKTAWSQSGSWKKNERNSTDFRFTFMEASFHNVINLTIIWQEAVPANDVKYLQNKNGFYFTNDEKNFYGNKIVKDIRVYR